MMRGALLVAAALAAAVVATPARAAPADPWPGVASAYLVRIDGEVRWAANDAARLKPASLTKMLTAILVAEALAPGDTVVVGKRAAAADGVRLGLRAGMRLPADHLLAAALLRSANDACLALAERVAGSEAAFVARMNERASVKIANAVCDRVAPSAMIWRRNSGLTLSTLVIVSPIVNGSAITICAAIIALGVNNQRSEPSGPLRDNNR